MDLTIDYDEIDVKDEIEGIQVNKDSESEARKGEEWPGDNLDE